MADIMSALLETSNDIFDKLNQELFDKRILVFNDEVDACVIENYVLYILKWNADDNCMGIPVEKREPIKIYFNSPGGSTIQGGVLMDIIMHSTTPVVGVAFSLVASMAYHIYLSCKDRIAFPNSIFLQHDGEIEVSNTSSKVKDTVKFFESMDERFKRHVLNRTAMTEEFYDEKYEQEYWMYADEAKKYGIVHKIIGEDCFIEDIL